MSKTHFLAPKMVKNAMGVGKKFRYFVPENGCKPPGVEPPTHPRPPPPRGKSNR